MACGVGGWFATGGWEEGFIYGEGERMVMGLRLELSLYKVYLFLESTPYLVL